MAPKQCLGQDEMPFSSSRGRLSQACTDKSGTKAISDISTFSNAMSPKFAAPDTFSKNFPVAKFGGKSDIPFG